MTRHVDAALCEAAFRGDVQTVRQCLAFGANVHACAANKLPDEALYEAVLQGHMEMVRVLLQAKADINVRSFYDPSETDFAIKFASSWHSADKSADLAELLLMHNANPFVLSSDFVNEHLNSEKLETIVRVMRIGTTVLDKNLHFKKHLFHQHYSALIAIIHLYACTDLCRFMLLYV